MSILNRTLKQQATQSHKLALLLVITLSVTVAIGALVAQEPMLAIGAVLAIILMLAVIASPDTATLVVIFILYTNAAVVAVRFHGVPFVVGALPPVLLVIPLSYYLIIRREKLIVTSALPLVFLFLVIQVLGTLFSERITDATSNLITFMVEGFAIYFLITNVVRTPKMLRRVIWVLLIAGAFMGGLSLFQQVTGTFNTDYGGFAQVTGKGFGTGVESLQGEIEQQRLSGPIGEKNRYAQIMLMLIPLGLFQLWGERSHWLRILAVIFTGLILAGATLTFSRGAAVGLILMLIIIVFMRYLKLYQLVVVVLGLVLIMQLFPQYNTRLASLQVLRGLVSEADQSVMSEADGAIRGRATEMLAAARVFADHPVIGVGPGLFKYYSEDYAELVGIRAIGTRQAHTLYLGIAADNGALGLICFLAIVFVTLRDLARTRRRWMQSHPELANMATGFLLAIVAYMTTGLFLHLAYIRYLWLMLGLAAAAFTVANPALSAQKESVGKQ